MMKDRCESFTGRNQPAKVLMTKIGLDGHDRGSRLVTAFLREAGMDVASTGPWQSIEDVVRLAKQTNSEVIGISSLAGDHLLLPKLMAALADAGLGHVAVVVGGIVPDGDLPALEAAGVSKVFHPGAQRAEIVAEVAALAARARLAELEVTS